MATPTAATLDRVSDAVREQARAEARTIVSMLDHRDAEHARTASLESTMRRQVERSAIALTLGEAMRLSEGQVIQRLSVADTVRDHAPRVWDAFVDGDIDLVRVRDIASTIEKLQRAESIHRLEDKVLNYAATHTAAELRAWLRRFIQRVEADLATERAEDEKRNRHVTVRHGDDGMSDLYGRLPSHEAAAIEARLRKEARKPKADGDERTIPQIEADLLVAWLIGSEAATAAIDANIAVTIDADVLAGAVAGFAESSDGRWAIPAKWIAAVTGSGNTFWHRIVLEPVTGDVLSHEYVGRFAPDILRIALQFLHGVCQAPGCMVPAERCDMDHRRPHPEGPTTGDNMGPFCRGHHQLKGHGLLYWTTQPPDPPPIDWIRGIYCETTNIAWVA